MKYIYNKLVRDKIPQEINKIEGRKANFKILNHDEYLQELDKKLLEEAHEFIEEHNVEELGDLMEVILAIMEAKDIYMDELEKVRKIKNSKKGAFKDKVYLIDVEEENCGENKEE